MSTQAPTADPGSGASSCALLIEGLYRGKAVCSLFVLLSLVLRWQDTTTVENPKATARRPVTRAWAPFLRRNLTERSSRTRNEDVDRAERRRERQKWRMEARERDQRSRGTRVDNPSRALPHAFSNERMVRVGTRGIMFDGCCCPEGRKATRCSVSSTKSDGEIIGRPLESTVCPIICCGLKAEPPERGRGTPRDSRTSRRRKNDEMLGTLEPLRHSQGLDDERLPPKDPFPTGISSPMAFHPLHLPLPALPKCGLRHVSPEHSSRTR